MEGWMDGEIEGGVDTPLERNVFVRLSTRACRCRCRRRRRAPSFSREEKCPLFVVMPRTQLTESRLFSTHYR